MIVSRPSSGWPIGAMNTISAGAQRSHRQPGKLHRREGQAEIRLAGGNGLGDVAGRQQMRGDADGRIGFLERARPPPAAAPSRSTTRRPRGRGAAPPVFTSPVRRSKADSSLDDAVGIGQQALRLRRRIEAALDGTQQLEAQRVRSIARMALLTAGCEMPRKDAAPVIVPLRITAWKISSWRAFMAGP